MPSFLNDENTPIYAPNSGVVHLDNSNPGLKEKLISNPFPTGIDQYHEKSSGISPQENGVDHLSSSDSFTTGQPLRMNGASTTGPLPNGRSSRMSSNGVTASDAQPTNGVNGKHLSMERYTDKPLPGVDGGALVNGTTTTTPSQLPAPPSWAQQQQPHKLSESQLQLNSLTTSSSPARNSLQQTPVESPSPNADGPYANSRFPGNLTPDPTRSLRLSGQGETPPPHRFSSPAQYGPSQSTSALQPPTTTLKQRHTLEVPRLHPPGRSSTSTEAYSTGRFSPTNGPGGSEIGGRRASLSLGRRNTRSIHSEMHRDEVLPDDDATRWAEAYRQKRARRKRREEEDEDKVLVGTKVDETHANWETAYNMLTGIRVSVSRTNAKIDRPLTEDDFVAKQKSTFDIAGNELVPSAKYDFKFKDYAPWVFRHLRALFRLDPADYLMSLTGKYILSELGSPGKSGSFFYFSRDYKYIIKTIHHAEHKFMRKILKDYYNHVTDNPNTLLSQFYGLHRVKMPYGKKIHFVVMNNLFPPHRDIHTTFDLKGSTVGRDYKEDDLEKNPRATLKDLNWLRRKRHLELGMHKKQMFLKQLQEDVKLLQKLKIMDYSLLIGIHDLRKGNEENLRDKTLQVFNPGGAGPAEDPSAVLMRTPSKLESARKARELRQMIKAERPVPMGQSGSKMPSELEEGHTRGGLFYSDDGGLQATHEDNTPAEEVYYLGVIDCLTHYGMIKKIEHFWKGLSSDRTQISALPPVEYGDRFLKFMSGISMSPEEAERDARDRQAAAAAAAEAEAAETAAAAARDADQARLSRIGAPPAPTYLPPPPPGQRNPRSPEPNPTLEMAMRKATLKEKDVAKEDEVPERHINSVRTSSGAVLPIVEETAEASSLGGRRSPSGSRPFTPAQRDDGYTDLGPHGLGGRGPPTPPKANYIDVRSKRSSGGGDRVIDRNSLEKALPPLPR